MNKKLKLRQLPNIITFINLLLGYLSILLIFKAAFHLDIHLYSYITYFILLATIFDFLDGKLSRYLNMASDIGLELDSMADLISFGLAPALLFHVMVFGPNAIYALTSMSWGLPIYVFGFVISCIFLLSTLLRLARFNISNKSKLFTGLPSTIAGGTLTLLLCFNFITPLYIKLLPDFILSSETSMSIINATNTIPMNGNIATILLLLYSFLMNSPFQFPKLIPNFLRLSKQFSKKDHYLSMVYFVLLVLSVKHFVLIYSIAYTGNAIYKSIRQ